MKKLLVCFIAVICLGITLETEPGFAQQGIPIGPGDGDSEEVPLDGLSILAAAGGAYAIKKLRERSE